MLGCRGAASPTEDHLRDHFALDYSCHLRGMSNIIPKLRRTILINLRGELSKWFHHKAGEVC
jgi:hypothetical protein